MRTGAWMQHLRAAAGLASRDEEQPDVRPLGSGEAALLGPALSAVVGFAALLADHAAGRATVCVAWQGLQPVGMASIRWQPPPEPAVRLAYPDCAEIHAVEVVASRRSAGIGSRLVAVCEDLAVARGHGSTGVGVAVDNVHAYALYLRLGYAEPQRVEYDGPGGGRMRFLVKP